MSQILTREEVDQCSPAKPQDFHRLRASHLALLERAAAPVSGVLSEDEVFQTALSVLGYIVAGHNAGVIDATMQLRDSHLAALSVIEQGRAGDRELQAENVRLREAHERDVASVNRVFFSVMLALEWYAERHEGDYVGPAREALSQLRATFTLTAPSEPEATDDT